MLCSVKFLYTQLLLSLKNYFKFVFTNGDKGLNNLVNDEEATNILRFEISTEKMNELLERHQICAADIRCLDANSKQCLKELCLKSCLCNTIYTDSESGFLENPKIVHSSLQIEHKV